MSIFSSYTMRFARTAVIAALILTVSSWATAQTATVKGCIRNGSGQPVAGAVVVLESPSDTALVLSTRTDGQGLYQISGLKVGVYQLRIGADGYERKKLEGITLQADEIRVVDLNITALSATGQAEPQFYDEPQFTVAGVTDTTNLGTHGADTVVRNTESLVRETASLNKAGGNAVSASPDNAALQSLREAVQHEPD